MPCSNDLGCRSNSTSSMNEAASYLQMSPTKWYHKEIEFMDHISARRDCELSKFLAPALLDPRHHQSSTQQTKFYQQLPLFNDI